METENNMIGAFALEKQKIPYLTEEILGKIVLEMTRETNLIIIILPPAFDKLREFPQMVLTTLTHVRPTLFIFTKHFVK